METTSARVVEMVELIPVTKAHGLQKEEVKQAKYEKMEVIKQMMNDGDFFIYDYLDELEKAKLK